MAPWPFPERRREPRKATSGPVLIRPVDSTEAAFTGELVDVSPSGFRARHHFARLQAGELVEFDHAQGKGIARVVWVRIVGPSVETGFLVTEWWDPGAPAG